MGFIFARRLRATEENDLFCKINVDIVRCCDSLISVSRANVTNQPTNTMLKGNKFADKIKNSTLADATAWYESTEKTIFCMEFLDAFSVNEIEGFWQDELEDHFESFIVGAIKTILAQKPNQSPQSLMG